VSTDSASAGSRRASAARTASGRSRISLRSRTGVSRRYPGFGLALQYPVSNPASDLAVYAVMSPAPKLLSVPGGQVRSRQTICADNPWR